MDYVRDVTVNNDGTITVTIPEGSTIITPLQRQIIQHKKDVKQYIKYKGSNHPFTFMNVGCDCSDISPEAFCRLVYLSTYAHYGDNVLMATQRRALNQDDMMEILRISRSTFYSFKNEVMGKYIQFDLGKNAFIISDKAFKKDKLEKKDGNCWQRLYHNEFRALYNNISPSKHKLLGKMLFLLPHLNIYNNQLCYDRYENNSKYFQPFTLEDVCVILYSDPRRCHRLMKDLEQLTYSIGGKSKRFCILSEDEKVKDKKVFYNPEVIYRGLDPCTGFTMAFDFLS